MAVFYTISSQVKLLRGVSYLYIMLVHYVEYIKKMSQCSLNLVDIDRPNFFFLSFLRTQLRVNFRLTLSHIISRYLTLSHKWELPVKKEYFKPGEEGVLDALLVEFKEELLVVFFVKCFRKIKEYGINLFFII